RRQLSSLQSANVTEGADFCVWLPGTANTTEHLLTNDPAEPVTYSVMAHDQDGQSSTSIAIDIRTPAGAHVGNLQCTFPRASSAAGITFERWKAVVGEYLTLELRF